MSDQYKQWIQEYLERVENPYGRCKEAVEEMSKAFPELTKVAGHVETFKWGRRSHWWLTTPDGTIIDPTASQFPLIFAYEAFKPGSLVRVGKCMECGEEIWKPVQTLDTQPQHECICSKECEIAFTNWQNGN